MFETDICTISICRAALSSSGQMLHSLKHKINLNCWTLRVGCLLGKETSLLPLTTIVVSVSADLSFLFSRDNLKDPALSYYNPFMIDDDALDQFSKGQSKLSGLLESA